MFAKSVLLIFILLNPFILSVYLEQVIRALSLREFSRQMVRAGVISLVVFLLFAWGGEAVFEDVMQVSFAAFLVFGGIIFLVVGIRLILGVKHPLQALDPEAGEVSGAIAMPFIVGPGTISAAVFAGSELGMVQASTAIFAGLGLAIGAMLIIKWLHDYVRTRNERLVTRYTEVAGRVTALFTGTFAIELIFTGMERWLAALPGG